jgi:DnaJ-class molecular chaperone
MRFVLGLLVSLFSTAIAADWETEDFEIFDLTDELRSLPLTDALSATFYTALEIEPTSTQAEINKAYRKKAQALHPYTFY